MNVFVEHMSVPTDIKEAVLTWEMAGRKHEVPLDRFDAKMHKVLFNNLNRGVEQDIKLKKFEEEILK